MYQYLNLHVLRTIPYHNLNRDDTGSPKTLIYGGTLRSRLSSQSLKRAMRMNFEAISPSDRSNRSKLVTASIVEKLNKLVPEDLPLSAEETAEAEKHIKENIAKLTNKDKSEPGDTLVWISETEEWNVARRALGEMGILGDPPKNPIQAQTASLTISAFGRMFANSPDLQTEAAVQVAHAFTTNEAIGEVDYFTAVDDLRIEDSGAGHLAVSEYTSGVYYEHIVVDRRQLRFNWLGINEENAKTRLIDFYKSILLSLPNGKVNATAPHSLPDFILATPATMPISFAGAFEEPVSANNSGGYVANSIEKLKSYQAQARDFIPEIWGEPYTARLSGEEGTFNSLVEKATQWTLN